MSGPDAGHAAGPRRMWGNPIRFPLFDHAGFIFEQIFDGVFQRDDAFFVFFVYHPDHRGQGGAFARSGMAGHNHHAPGQIRLLDNRRQVQIFQIRNLIGNGAEGNSDAVFLIMGIDTESASVVDHGRKIQISLFFKFFEFGLSNHIDNHRGGIFIGYFGQIHNDQFSIDAHYRRQRGIDMYVRSAGLNGHCQHIFDTNHAFLLVFSDFFFSTTGFWAS